ncbi:amino acid adenylation domain-containing protein, partial [Immundisolibacter sp.]|uniref:amino acid adenylation domain-containing protein n=1 Tax=Immundisolibacter sp. TaxID=1934948 RepID=UPI003561772C
QLAAIWSEVLGIERIGRHDNFFDLGGHSLLAVRVIGEILTRLGTQLQLADLFETPTVEGLVAALQASGARDSANLPAIVRSGQVGQRQLSFAQERLWFMHELAGHSPDSLADIAYNMSGAVSLHGPLSTLALAQAFESIAARHEILRSAFAFYGNEWVQTLAAPKAWLLPLVDLSALPAEDREAEVARWKRVEATRSFDLVRRADRVSRRTQLLRTRLLRLGRNEHLLIVTMHHIVADLWSLEVLVNDLRVAYAAALAGHPPSFPALPVQYSDYALWQRQSVASTAYQKQLSYWQQRLKAVERLEVPTDFPPPAVRSFAGAVVPLRIGTTTQTRLRALATRHKASLFMVLLAGLKLLFHRYSGQTDIVVGTTVANRNRPELAPLIGFFVNTLAIRTDLGGDPSFAELLKRLRDGVLTAQTNQDVPFEHLVAELQLPHDMSSSPLFQVLFLLQDERRATPMTLNDDLSLSFEPIATGTAKFDLQFTLRDTADGIEGEVEFATDLFQAPGAGTSGATLIERLVGHYLHLLEQAAEQPENPLSGYALLPAAERDWLIHGLNDTRVEYSSALLVHELIGAQAVRRPDAIALRFEQSTLSYAELERRANQLAHQLIAWGVGQDVLVGVCMERSLEMVVALLGVLKAGGAYMPLDPELPAARLDFMLTDSAVSIVLTQARFKHLLQRTDGNVLALDESNLQFAHLPDRAPSRRCTGEHLFNVIYTSGSTGHPKGVMVRHAGILNRLQWMHAAYPLRADDRVVQKTPYSFDVSVWEFFWPLMVGAQLVIARPGGHRDPDYLRDLIVAEQITTLHFVPSMLAVFLLAPDIEQCLSLRAVFCSGEALTKDQVTRFFSRLTARLHNLYGPTEASVDVSFWDCKRDDQRPSVPIGRPIANTQLYVLDERLEPLPMGVPGELYIGGVGLARGYLNRPQLTAERFVADPFHPDTGARLYRTGDLVRLAQDGALEYLGRTDFQVKVRGFRIELGEIEAVLLSDPGVAAAVVVARPDAVGDTQLVAYVAGAGADCASLQQRLQAALPDYMLPRSIELLAELPLSANGKVDRKALPEPGWQPVARPPVTPLTTATELRLARIWEQLLACGDVGKTDNFFLLGGNSLSAARLVASAREAFGVELPLREVFQLGTLEELARLIESLSTSAAPQHMPPLRSLVHAERTALSFAQRRMWMLDELESSEAAFSTARAYNMSGGVRISGPLVAELLEQAMDVVVARHEVLRTTFEIEHGEIWQSVVPEQRVPVDLIDLQSDSPTQQQAALEQLARQEATRSFDLVLGRKRVGRRTRLIRLRLARLTADQHILFVTMHHIISDGWSLRILVDELLTAYEALRGGRVPTLPELPVQYRDYAVWQREWLTGDLLDQQLAYWRRQLDGVVPVELWPDRPRPTRQSFAGRHVRFTVPGALSRQLRELCQQHGVTPFVALLAVFKVFLYRHTGQEDLCVGTPVANRARAAVEPLIGFFVNTLALRSQIPATGSFVDLLGQLQQTVLDGFTYQDLPFEYLVDHLDLARDQSRNALFQVMFALQDDVLEQRPGAGALQVAPYLFETGVAKFDLTLTITEREHGFAGEFEYNTKLFDGERIERMVEHFERLLAGVCANPTAPLRSLALLSAAEYAQVVHDWNRTAMPVPSTGSVADRFEAHARQTPGRIALVDAAETLTYAELDRRADYVASLLLARGIGAGDLVGVCLRRSARLVVAELAALKLGAAYVPLDPDQPEERIAAMLADSGLRVLLAEADRLDVAAGLDCVCLPATELDGEVPPGSSAACQRPAQTDHSLAYVIYTSGSTGKPKGVCVPHAALNNLIFWHQTVYETDGEDRATLLTGPGFDASVWDIWPYLTAGASLHIPADEVRMDPRRLVGWLVEQRITRSFMPTPLA